MMELVSARIDQGWTDRQIADELLAGHPGPELPDRPLSWQTVGPCAVPGLALQAGPDMAPSRRRESVR